VNVPVPANVNLAIGFDPTRATMPDMELTADVVTVPPVLGWTTVWLLLKLTVIIDPVDMT
jgi:hypothetical protein